LEFELEEMREKEGLELEGGRDKERSR